MGEGGYRHRVWVGVGAEASAGEEKGVVSGGGVGRVVGYYSRGKKTWQCRVLRPVNLYNIINQSMPNLK